MHRLLRRISFNFEPRRVEYSLSSPFDSKDVVDSEMIGSVTRIIPPVTKTPRVPRSTIVVKSNFWWRFVLSLCDEPRGRQGTLTPTDTWSPPIRDLYVVLVETNSFPELVIFTDYICYSNRHRYYLDFALQCFLNFLFGTGAFVAGRDRIFFLCTLW